MLACDYDGTLAHDGRVAPETIEALRRLKGTGRRVVLVTGRRIEDLKEVFGEVGICDLVVAENGGLIYAPASQEVTALAEAPDARFVEALRARGVNDLAVGRAIVATWEPHAQAVLDAIRELGLELQVVFNKGAVMVLPSGVNKATGLAAALARLGLSPHNAVGVGDAENDHALLAACELGVAVANALPALRERADLLTLGDHGAGVAELCDRLCATDLAELGGTLQRHDLPLGSDVATGEEIHLPAFGAALLVAGTSGGGKSTAVTGLVEHLAERGYQHVIIDPEGDYGTYDRAVVIGDERRAPTVAEVVAALAKPETNVVVNLLGLSLELRPAFFAALLPPLLELRGRLGRPHWIVVDEAHHLMPGGTPGDVPSDLGGFILVTVHPEHVARAAIAAVGHLLALGKTPHDVLREFAAAAGASAPDGDDEPLATGEALYWTRGSSAPPRHIRVAASRTERQRHARKYAEGDLGADKSFYFRGADGRLNLRAQNLGLFLQLGDGVDAATWLHHLRAGDYSRWALESIKDEELAAEIAAVERATNGTNDAAASRAAIRHVIEARYTAPAAASPA
ncbi:MAG TPA: HAD-IIB family hydrolase [Polyangia bacterium]|nr:HAD-IIB family hydrolase [Polyangia bacterium]